MQKTNFIFELILEIKLTHQIGHVQSCLTTPSWSNQLIFVGFIKLYLHLKIELNTSTCLYNIVTKGILHSGWSLGFWTITQEPDFSQTCCFLKKLKYHSHFYSEAKNHMSMDKILARTLKTSLLWDLLSPPGLSFFKKNGIHHFYYFMMFNLLYDV